jgi:ADP-heptose:LPS heptosyltransferase
MTTAALATSAIRVAWIRTDRLGETLLNLPAAAALKAAVPRAKLTLLVQPDLQPLLAGLPWVEAVLGVEVGAGRPWWREAWTLARTLRRHRFDVAVVSNPLKAIHAAVWLARIPQRVGYDRKWGGLLTDRIPDRKAAGDRHEVEYNCDLLRALQLPAAVPARWPFEVGLEPEGRAVQRLLAEAGVSSERFVAVHPWTSNPRKRWAPARYRALIERVSRDLATPVVVIGGAAERSQAAQVLPAGGPVADLTGRLDLRQLAALLQRARALISNDSGPVHLAAAVGTRVLALFGTSDPATGPRRWGPWGAGHRVICKPSMDAIALEEVMAEVRTLLA